jgi:hypothetical protein
MNARLAAVTAIVSLSLTQMASAAVFDGRVFISAVTSACTSAGAASVGNNFITVYNKPTSGKETFTFSYDRFAALYTPREGNTFSTSTHLDALFIFNNATSGEWHPTSTQAIKFSAVSASTTVVNMSGTVTNWNANGCTVTFRGALSLRP